MRNRLFAVVALAILISQPVILTSSIAIIPAADISNSKLIITAQDHGTRLAPSEHTNHVAILINGSDDFTSQGWPGAGTENNPFVISGLNITYDIDIPLIRIFNVDDYFVIEDCFVNQLSSYYAIHLENVTNAMIRYTTAISPYGSVICVNADGTTAENLLLVSGNKYGLYITNSESFDLTRSLVNTSSYNGVYLNGSAQSSISDSIIDSANPYFDIEIRYSNNVTVTDTEFHAAAIEVYIYRCAYFYGDGITSGEGTIGMYLYQSNDTEIVNADITSTDEALYSYSCLGLSISDSIFSSPTYIQETMDFTLCDNVLLDNIHLNNTGGDGIRLTQTNATIQNSLFTYIGDNAIELSQSHDTKIFSNTFEHIYNDAIYMSQSHRANVTGNIADDLGRFIVPQSSDNGTIYMNEIVDANAGVASWDCEGWEVYGNTISEVISGISVSLGAFFDVWENTITEASGAGIQTDTHGLFEAWENTITSCADIGISHVDSDSVYDRDNIITDCDAGIYLDGTIDSTFNDNIISDCIYGIFIDDAETSEFNGNNISYCLETGINLQYGVYDSFIDNNMVECGFLLLIEPLSEQLYNHSFSGNTVNGKPVYYAFNQTNIAIDGSLYGQVIIANCTDVSITEGEFIHATCGIQVMFSNNIEIEDVILGYQYMAAFALVCENLSFVDSTVTGRNEDFGIFIYETLNIWIENVNCTGVGGYWFGDPSAILIAYFQNATIKDCNFYNLDGFAVGLGTGVYGIVDSCNAFNVTAGVFAESVSLFNVTHNAFIWNEVGIYTDSCDDWILTDNNLHEGEVGLYRADSNDWYVANNTVMWNWIGIQYDTTSSVGIMADNIIAANFYQNGNDNTFEYWDDTVDTGNYWGDYSGTGTYTVDGSGGAIDRYPMKYIVTEPIINTPIDIWIAEGSIGNEILWLPYDNNLKNWEAEMDGSLWASGSWNFHNITVNVDGLAYGTHTIVITVWDLDLNSVSDTVIINVYDDTPPEIDGPPNQWLFVDATGQTIVWEVSDLNPDTYTLTVDDVEFDSGPWTSGTLSIDVDDIDEGEHTLVLTIYDIDGNSVSDTVLVRVIDDNTNPVIEDAEDVLYVEGTTGNTLDWSAEDDYPASYEVSFNGTVVEEGEWGGSDIIFDVDGLSPGIYEYTLTVYDHSGNSATSSANVTVVPLVPIEPPLLIDWVLVLIIGAVAGGAVVVVAIIYYLRKKQTS